VQVERLAWDALEVRLGDGDGTAVPGASLPISLGFNILAPEVADVTVHYSAELRPIRGGEILSQVERSELAATNSPQPSVRNLALSAPTVEGMYLIEVKAWWEPLADAEANRVSRLFRRRRAGLSASVTRRLTLAVVGSTPLPATGPPGAEALIDEIDPSRLRGRRASAWGRSSLAPGGDNAWPIPEAALVDANRRDRLRGWILRNGAETAVLGQADGSGLAWSAWGMKVTRPWRPHRLSLTVNGGPSALGVALIVPGLRPRVLLDACASGAPGATGARATFSWPVWPDSAEPVLIVVNRSPASPVRIEAVELFETASDPPAAPLVETHPESPRILAIHLAGRHALDRFGGAVDGGPADTLSSARNLAAYLIHCGASTVILPDELADRERRRSLDGQGAEDAHGPDRLDLILRILSRHGLTAVLEVSSDGPLPGLPAPDSAEALARGIVRIDQRGQADGPAYQPLRLEVRKSLSQRALAAVAPRQTHANLTGLLVRLGAGATLPGAPETGLDDVTYERFLRASFTAEDARTKPGTGSTDPGRFATRHQFLAGAGRLPWLAWRATELGELYGEIARTIEKTSPGLKLVISTPSLDAGAAGDEARRADLAGLPPTAAWKSVGFDLSAWPADGKTVILRSVSLSADDLGHDLATSPELDEPVAARPGRGLLLGVDAPSASGVTGLRMTALPLAGGPMGDEPLGHALAALDARWVVISGAVAAGQEERVRKFARVFRALPANPDPSPPPSRMASGISARSWTLGERSYLAFANDTPYTIRIDTLLAAPPGSLVDDLGRGLRLDVKPSGNGLRLVLDLVGYGASAVRVGHAGVSSGPVTAYLMDKPGLDAQAEAMSALLDKPAMAEPAGPPNGACEPAESRPPLLELDASRNGTRPPAGWSASGDGSNTVEIDLDRPHGGRGSLRLDARTLPASVTGEMFAAPAGPALAIRCWLRAMPADLPVRVWLEGQSGGRPHAQYADVAAPASWGEFTIRAGALPVGGFDRLRVRLEPLAPGRLWVDDLAMSGQGSSEPDRRARRTLAAAVHAYREGRYADFARLASSRWARRQGTETESDYPPLPPDPAGPIRTGDASGLSPTRRLR
jgi:hypothetical protein